MLVQPGLCRTCSEKHIVGFPTRRLIFRDNTGNLNVYCFNLVNFIHVPVHGRSRSKRSASIAYGIDRPLSFTAFKCYYTDCIPPPDPDTVAPLPERPAVYDFWDDVNLWNVSSDGYLVNIGGSSGIPQDYDNIRVEFGELFQLNIYEHLFNVT